MNVLTRSVLPFILLVLPCSAAIGAEGSPGASESSLPSRMEDSEGHPVESTRSLVEKRLNASINRVDKLTDRGNDAMFNAHGDFGKIETPGQAKELVASNLPVFGLSGSEKLIYRGIASNTYSFTELINGIPVLGGGIELSVDEQGELVQITNTTMPESDASRSPPKRRIEEVESAAIDAVRRKTESASPNVTKIESEVFHDRDGGFVWLVTVTIRGAKGQSLKYQAYVRDEDLKAAAGPMFFGTTGKACDAQGNPTTECTGSAPVLVAVDGIHLG